MKIAILTNGPIAYAGARLRGYWMETADPVHIKAYAPGEPLAGINECDAVVFQKVYDTVAIERARRYRLEGKIVVFDVVDPVWWFSPEHVADMFRAAHVVTTSNHALTEAVSLSGIVKHVATIPDRMLPSFHPTWKQHTEQETVKLVWYGSAGNRIALEGYLPALGYIAHNRNIELRIIDDAPGAKVMETEMGHLKIRNVPWTLETYHAQLLDCDIAYLPPYPGPWGRLKSNNRQVTAWWAGLPVVDGEDVGEMVRLIESASERQTEAAANRKIAESHYDVHQSVAELIGLVGHMQGVTVQEPHSNGAKEPVRDAV